MGERGGMGGKGERRGGGEREKGKRGLDFPNPNGDQKKKISSHRSHPPRTLPLPVPR